MYKDPLFKHQTAHRWSAHVRRCYIRQRFASVISSCEVDKVIKNECRERQTIDMTKSEDT